MTKGVLRHLGIIMDGNRRWAKERNLPTIEGHRTGYEKMKDAGDWCLKRGIEILSVYAFSTENWNRSEEEISYLMKLLKKALSDELQEFHKKNIRLMVSGRRDRLPDELAKAIDEATELTKGNAGGILNICLNYGGRPEIVDAVKKIVSQNVPAEEIDEETIAKNLYSPELPDPDLIIRTSGEQRLSGFQLWECAYSELYFATKHWPAFEEEDLDEALENYAQRQRRFGGN